MPAWNDIQQPNVQDEE